MMISINYCPFVCLKVASFVVVGVEDGEGDGVEDTLLIIFLFLVRSVAHALGNNLSEESPPNGDRCSRRYTQHDKNIETMEKASQHSI